MASRTVEQEMAAAANSDDMAGYYGGPHGEITVTAEEARRAIEEAEPVTRVTFAVADRSNEQGALVGALCKARAKFERVEAGRTAEVVTKPKEGRPAGKYSYNYASLADVIDATAEALAENGIAIFQGFEQARGAITILTEIVHESGQWRRTRLTMPVPQNAGPQEIAGSITYGRRYARLAILDLAPSEDDDAADAQKRTQSQRGDVDAEAVVKMRETDPAGAFAEARKLVTAKKGEANNISEPRLKRLLAITREGGWNEASLNRACVDHLGVPANAIPWQAYDLIVELFRGLRMRDMPLPGQKPGQRPSVDDVAAAMAREDAEIADKHLAGDPTQRDGADDPQQREREPGEDDDRDDLPATPSVPQILAAYEPEGGGWLTPQEAWKSAQQALEALRIAHPDAAGLPLSPGDRLNLFKPALNGNRSTGDVAGVVGHHLALPLEQLPACMGSLVARILQAFPVEKPGGEEVLQRLPRDPAGTPSRQLADVLKGLEADGLFDPDTVKRSGEGGKVTKGDLVEAIGLVRDGALGLAGRRG